MHDDFYVGVRYLASKSPKQARLAQLKLLEYTHFWITELHLSRWTEEGTWTSNITALEVRRVVAVCWQLQLVTLPKELQHLQPVFLAVAREVGSPLANVVVRVPQRVKSSKPRFVQLRLMD